MRTIRWGAMTAVLGVTMACTDTAAGPLPRVTMADRAGTYTLQTVNGTAVPAVVLRTPTERATIMSGALLVEAGGYLSESDVKEWVHPPNVVQSGMWEPADYAVSSDTTIRFTRRRDGSTGTGSLSGRTLTLYRADSAFAYVKQ